MRVASTAAVFGLACFALAGCERASYRVTPAPTVAAAGHEQPMNAPACLDCAASTKIGYPVSARIACGPKLENHDEATGPVTLGKGNTLVYRSARTGRRVEVKGLCEVRFTPSSFAQAAR